MDDKKSVWRVELYCVTGIIRNHSNTVYVLADNFDECATKAKTIISESIEFGANTEMSIGFIKKEDFEVYL